MLIIFSLSKAIAKDSEFDQEVDKFINHIISVLDDHKNADEVSVTRDRLSKREWTVDADQISVATEQSQQNTDWNIQDVFASFFAVEQKKPVQPEPDHQLVLTQEEKFRGAHHSVSIILRVLLGKKMAKKMKKHSDIAKKRPQ